MSAVAAPPSFAPVEAKMKEAGLSDAAIAAFRLNFDALASGATGLVREEEGREQGKRGAAFLARTLASAHRVDRASTHDAPPRTRGRYSGFCLGAEWGER